MRGTLLGTLGGLVVGTLGTLAFSHYVQGDGATPVQAETKHAATATGNSQELKSEVDALSAQIQQLSSSNDDLKHQLADAKTSPPPPAPTINPMMIAGMMRGGFQTQQKLLLLKSRLHLTPDQEAAVKTAMEADARQRGQLIRQLFRGGQSNNAQTNASGNPSAPPAAANPNSLDQTLASILTPDQMASYKQVQTDVKTSQADTSATSQVDQVAPLLQLSDSQKDQVYNALYQVQIAAPDPVSLLGNPDAASILAAQSKATEAALANVLTPDQMALYQQAEQTMPRFGRGMRGGGGGGGGAPPGGQ